MPINESQAPKKTGLMELILQSQGSQFVIPVYQRNYTWTCGKEVKQYFDDLKAVLLGQYNKHFMGIMIYLDNRNYIFRFTLHLPRHGAGSH